ncbi:hypothetical protein, partial [Stutzerimonas stutzeri]|uniref:hypothetical protein n=1 Tax=Stutzerimonas stutzeri TaxID=316 RepID=UPI001BD691AC
PIERPERLFRLDAHNLLLSGRGEEGGRLVRVDLRRCSTSQLPSTRQGRRANLESPPGSAEA